MLAAVAATLLIPGVVLYFLVGAIRRRRGAREILSRAMHEPIPDERVAESLAILGGCSACAAPWFRRELLDRYEAATGRRLSRTWIFGERVARELERLCKSAPEGGDGMYRARTRPRPPHVKWAVAVGVIAWIGGVALIKWSNRHMAVEAAVYGVVIGGMLAYLAAFRRAGWWARPCDEGLELIRRDRRGRIVERRALDDPDPLIMIHERRVGRRHGGDAVDLCWVLVPSSGAKVEIDDLDPAFAPWL